MAAWLARSLSLPILAAVPSAYERSSVLTAVRAHSARYVFSPVHLQPQSCVPPDQNLSTKSFFPLRSTLQRNNKQQRDVLTERARFGTALLCLGVRWMMINRDEHSFSALGWLFRATFVVAFVLKPPVLRPLYATVPPFVHR